MIELAICSTTMQVTMGVRVVQRFVLIILRHTHTHTPETKRHTAETTVVSKHASRIFWNCNVLLLLLLFLLLEQAED